MSTKHNVGTPVKFEGLLNPDCRSVITFFDDFLDSSFSTADVAKWMLGSGNAGAISIAEATDAQQEMCGGLAQFVVEATASDVASIRLNGLSFQIDQGYPMYFESRFMNVDVTAVQTFIGLTVNDETAVAGVVSGIGFEGVGTTLSTICDNAGSTENVDDTGITLADGQWYKVAFYYDGDDTVTFYVDTEGAGFVQVNELNLSETTDYVPQDIMMTPTIECENAAGDGSADIVYVDYVLVQQSRCFTQE